MRSPGLCHSWGTGCTSIKGQFMLDLAHDIWGNSRSNTTSIRADEKTFSLDVAIAASSLGLDIFTQGPQKAWRPDLGMVSTWTWISTSFRMHESLHEWCRIIWRDHSMSYRIVPLFCFWLWLWKVNPRGFVNHILVWRQLGLPVAFCLIFQNVLGIVPKQTNGR